MRGRATTIEEKKATGTVNTTRERRKGEPVYPASVQVVTVEHDSDGNPVEITIPTPPEGLSDKACEVWDRNCTQLAVMGLFPNSAIEYLVTFCRLFDISERAYQRVIEQGDVVTSSANGQEIINPSYRIYSDAFDRMMAIGAKFGFTPYDKAKLSSKAIDEASKRKDKNSQKRITVTG